MVVDCVEAVRVSVVVPVEWLVEVLFQPFETVSECPDLVLVLWPTLLVLAFQLKLGVEFEGLVDFVVGLLDVMVDFVVEIRVEPITPQVGWSRVVPLLVGLKACGCGVCLPGRGRL